MSSASSPLLIVEMVLRYKQKATTLDYLGRLVADYLGPDRSLPLSAACEFGSTTLLDWIWESSPTSATERSPHWSLTNYLRSDPHYYQYQFLESMLRVIWLGDLRVIQWLMEHFSGCEVPVCVTEVAATTRRLDILQCLLEHDAGRANWEAPSRKKRRVDTEEGGVLSERTPSEFGVKGGNVVHWGGGSMERAALVKRFDIVRFLYENTPGGAHSYALGTTVRLALDAGELDLAEELLPAGGNILDYGKFSSNPAVLERSFAAGQLNDELHAGVALEKLVQSGSLELMKKIWQKHDQLASTGDWMQHWLQGMVTACKMGGLVVLQWMVEHTSGRAAIAHFKQNNKLSPLLYHATFANHLNVMQYLQEYGAAADYGNSLLCAIRIGNMDAVTWLIEHFPPSEKIPEYCVLVEAARYGWVEMLEYFQSCENLGIPGFPGSKESSIPEADTKFSSEVLTSAANRCSRVPACFTSRWRPTDAMDDAAANGKMGAVQWLHNNRSEGCTAKAMDEAAANGQLEVLKWLHANRSEGYTDSAILNAASKDHADTVKWLVTQAPEIAEIAMTHAVVNGNLDLVKWLHTEAKARCTVAAMICAASHGRLEILKYLYSRRLMDLSLEGCGNLSEAALAEEHVRVGYWCLTHLPAHSPTSLELSTYTGFEVLLFVHLHYPELFIPRILAKIRVRMGFSEAYDFQEKWLDALVTRMRLA